MAHPWIKTKTAYMVLIFFGVFSIGRMDCRAGNRVQIIWQKPFQKMNAVVIPGSLPTAFGRMEIRWIIPSGGMARLVMLESSGSAELPPREKKLWLVVEKPGRAVLMAEWLPLANCKAPAVIRPIATVAVADLFSVLPKTELPPVAKSEKTPQPIAWGRPYVKGDSFYLPGSLRASFGRLNIDWRKRGAGIPELITLESSGSGELPPRETRLYVWMDEGKRLSTLWQERQPLLNQGITSYLWPLATVRTDELMAGFGRANEDLK